MAAQVNSLKDAYNEVLVEKAAQQAIAMKQRALLDELREKLEGDLSEGFEDFDTEERDNGKGLALIKVADNGEVGVWRAAGSSLNFTETATGSIHQAGLLSQALQITARAIDAARTSKPMKGPAPVRLWD